MTAEMRRRQIKNILSRFDFEHVAAMMARMDWTWVGIGHPTPAQLKETAKYLLMQLPGGSQSVSTGGLQASWCNRQTLKLSFVVAEWTAFEETWR